MAVHADSIRRLTRAYLGARAYQGLVFWVVLALNIYAAIQAIGDPNPRVQLWLLLFGVVAAATLGTYYRRRFGRLVPLKPSPWDRPFQGFRFGVIGATALATLVIAVFVLGAEAGARPRDLGLLMLSGSTALSLASSRDDRQARMMAVAATAVLLATLVIPVLRPFQVVGHLGMAAALAVTAVQLHLFMMREFRHANV